MHTPSLDQLSTLATSETLQLTDAPTAAPGSRPTLLGVGSHPGSNPWARTIKAGIDSDGNPLDSAPEWTIKLPSRATLPVADWLNQRMGEGNLEFASSAAELASVDLEVLDTIGEGGMGLVQLAAQHSLQREVAIKRLKPGVHDEHAAKMLLHEGLITGMLEHPNIIPVHAILRGDDGAPILVMKRVSGVPWLALIQDPEHEQWTVPARERLRWHIEVLIHACNAAHFAHTRGIIHRDIKPENIMIGSFGEVYLLDWGIGVQLDENGEAHAMKFAGTLQYMAPEMIDSHIPLTPHTDIYLLGATLHEAITGTPRHTGKTFIHILKSAQDSEPFDYGEDIPAELASICHRAMHADPAQRYASARALREALERFLEHRHAIELSQSAHRRFQSLIERIEAPDNTNEEAQETIEQLATECRYALHKSLEIWPENDQASETAQELSRRMFDYEITREHLRGARSILKHIDDPTPEMLAALEALERTKAERQRAHERLEALARDLDTNVGSDKRSRVMIITSIIVLIPAIFLVTGAMPMAMDVDPTSTFFGTLVLVVLIAIVGAIHREDILINTANVRLTKGGFFILGGLVLNRFYAMMHNINTDAMLYTDAALLSLGLWLMAITTDRRFAVAALIVSSDLMVVTLTNLSIKPVFAGAIFVSMFTMGVLWSTPFATWLEGHPRIARLLGQGVDP